MQPDTTSPLLVAAAHPGDFVWRAGGAIALHRAAGRPVTVVCATLGVKGEAGLLWQEPDSTHRSVAAARRREAEAAALALGADLVLLELDDYPLVPTTADTLRLSALMRALRPSVVLTHPPKDPGNVDHANMAEMVLQARTFATAPGYGPDTIPPPNVYYFEPHQPEQCDFKADVFLNVSDVWQTKRRAFEAIASQRAVWDYYERVALQRGAQAGRRAAVAVRHAEAYQKAFPSVVSVLA